MKRPKLGIWNKIYELHKVQYRVELYEYNGLYIAKLWSDSDISIMKLYQFLYINTEAWIISIRKIHLSLSEGFNLILINQNAKVEKNISEMWIAAKYKCNNKGKLKFVVETKCAGGNQNVCLVSLTLQHFTNFMSVEPCLLAGSTPVMFKLHHFLNVF